MAWRPIMWLAATFWTAGFYNLPAYKAQVQIVKSNLSEHFNFSMVELTV
jgi:hypothetical protein